MITTQTPCVDFFAYTSMSNVKNLTPEIEPIMSKVLVVDDIQDNVTLLSFELEDDGFEVLTAFNGQECLEKARKEHPDVILLDIRMPGMSGIETLEVLKEDKDTADIPVIMVSANNSDDNIIKALDIGAHDFVSKPIDYMVLAARMRSALRLSHALKELAKANTELVTLATTDPLTGCYNRRHFFDLARKEASKVSRHNHSLTVLMMDIDYFKSINDNYGHSIGDEALIKFADCCKSVCRDSDILGRIGGEEFALCCPDTDIRGASMLAERIRIRCERLLIQANAKTFGITISIGVSQFLPDDKEFDTALHRADILLYKAKHQGRNQCVSSLDIYSN